MNTPFKNKMLLLIIALLLISNVAVLFFFLNNKGDGGRGNKREDRTEKMKAFLKNEIGFTENQLQQVEQISVQHKEKMKAAFDSVKNNKQQQLKELGANAFSDSAIVQIVAKNVEQQKTMDQQMLTHFATIRKICTSEQMPKFDSLFYKVWERKQTRKNN